MKATKLNDSRFHPAPSRCPRTLTLRMLYGMASSRLPSGSKILTYLQVSRRPRLYLPRAAIGAGGVSCARSAEFVDTQGQRLCSRRSYASPEAGVLHTYESEPRRNEMNESAILTRTSLSKRQRQRHAVLSPATIRLVCGSRVLHRAPKGVIIILLLATWD
ncbi:hypothetical protein DENSPDRAFT_283608 [Dentipellis sp. KUC8613]|nr:hypothetical protein DENSPDRAFT_283608 [Dentipellis sp. KUC8613]